jgi:hypothetical protein
MQTMEIYVFNWSHESKTPKETLQSHQLNQRRKHRISRCGYRLVEDVDDSCGNFFIQHKSPLKEMAAGLPMDCKSHKDC